MTAVLINLAAMLLNITCASYNYEYKNYRTMAFNAFAAGLGFGAVLASLKTIL